MRTDKELICFPIHAELSGTLHQRMERSWARLHDGLTYERDKVFRPVDCAWPGDFEGRLLLGRILLSNLLNRESQDALWMLENYSCHANSDGYLGKVMVDEPNEQQLAGHGWLLRAFSEAQLRYPELDLKPLVQKIFDHLLQPLKKFLPDYPLSVGDRTGHGAIEGSIDRKIGNWQVSTDVGCVFILFDGLVQAMHVFGIECPELAKQMQTLAGRMEFSKVRAQTHASLTLARGLIRYANEFNVPELWNQAQTIYDLYRERAMTENFANYNWFGRPEWTEPCAIIDSFIVAMALFRHTGEMHYLSDAHIIWFSAVERSQRNHGGFGGDNCVRAEELVLRMKFFEAPNCCTMRGAEAFFERGMHSIFRTGETLTLALPAAGRFMFEDGAEVEVISDYPMSPAWKVHILKKGRTPICRIRGFTVSEGWRESESSGDPYQVSERPALAPGFTALWRGPVMQGMDEQGKVHSVNETWQMERSKAEVFNLRLLFPEQK